MSRLHSERKDKKELSEIAFQTIKGKTRDTANELRGVSLHLQAELARTASSESRGRDTGMYPLADFV